MSLNKLFIIVFLWFMSFSTGAVWMSGVWSDFIVKEGIGQYDDRGRMEWIDCTGRVQK